MAALSAQTCRLQPAAGLAASPSPQENAPSLVPSLRAPQPLHRPSRSSSLRASPSPWNQGTIAQMQASFNAPLHSWIV